MARKIKFISDSKLAKPHRKGAMIEIAQPSLHNVVGTIDIICYRMWLFHIGKAEKAFRRLKNLENKLLDIPVNASNSRFLSEEGLIEKIYFASFDLVVHSVLTVEYLSEEIFRISKLEIFEENFEKFTTSEKLRWICGNILGVKDLTNRSAYDKFIEMENIRHAIMHPKQETIYNAKDGEWDKVPLAWFVSGKWREAYTDWRKFLKEIVLLWENIKKKYEKPRTLIGVKRGIRSEEPVKLPKRT